MKKSDAFRLAAKHAFVRASALLMAGIAVAVYCACAGGGLVSGVTGQANEPYELIASAGSKQITENVVAQAGQTEGVLASSAEIEFKANLTVNDTVSQLSLDGIDPKYLQGEIADGAIFPQESAMPYVVLNGAAFSQMQDKNKDGNIDDSEKIDWQKASCSITLDEKKAITAKICGILADGSQDPKAYLSLSSAKTLAGGEYTTCLVRIQHANMAQDVSDKLSLLGLAVQNTELPQQADWDRKTTEATYLFLLAGAILVYTVCLYAGAENPGKGKRRKETEMLMYIGFSLRDIIGISCFENILHCGIAFGFGILFYALIPQFVSPEIGQSVNITYPSGPNGVISGAILALAAFLILFFQLKAGMYRQMEGGGEKEK